MAAEQVDRACVDEPTERLVYAYGAEIPGEMFALVIFRCPSCGTTGEAGSWCEGHSAPMVCGDVSLRVRREPVQRWRDLGGRQGDLQRLRR